MVWYLLCPSASLILSATKSCKSWQIFEQEAEFIINKQTNKQQQQTWASTTLSHPLDQSSSPPPPPLIEDGHRHRLMPSVKIDRGRLKVNHFSPCQPIVVSLAAAATMAVVPLPLHQGGCSSSSVHMLHHLLLKLNPSYHAPHHKIVNSAPLHHRVVAA
jgi:hypothetical protein